VGNFLPPATTSPGFFFPIGEKVHLKTRCFQDFFHMVPALLNAQRRTDFQMNAHFNGRKLGAQRAFCRRATTAIQAGLGLVMTALITQSAFAQTNLTSAGSAHELPDSASAMFSLFRVMGALALVLAVFFGGLWLFRNWQRAFVNRGRTPRLNVLEVKSLGQRHALYVVGYESQRMLVASSPTGITMLTTLPDDETACGDARPTKETGNGHKPGFTDALHLALHRVSARQEPRPTKK